MVASAAGVLLAEARRRPGRLLLTGLAITVATVFAAGTLLLGETLRSSLTAGSQRTPVGAAAVVLPGRLDGMPGQALVDEVAAVDGVVSAVGVWGGYEPVTGAGPTTNWELTSDPMGGPLTRLPGGAVQGTLPAGDDEVAVGEATAGRTGAVPGDTLTTAPDDGPPRTFTVTGIVSLPAESLNTIIATPAALMGLGGDLRQVDVAGAGTGAVPDVDAAVLGERIAGRLGSPRAVRTGTEQRAAELEEASASVTAVLVGVGVFAGLALVAAGVVVASTFRIVLTQRRTQLALLRCIGAGRRQVVGAVLAEAVVTGLVAGLLGVGVALLAGYGLLTGLAWSGRGDVPALTVHWPGLAGVLLVAVLATVLSALVPALAAARIPPVAALGSAGAGATGAPRTVRRLVLAGLLAVAAATLAWLALGEGPGSAELAMIVVAASGLVAFAALVAAGPVLVRGLSATVGRVIAVVGGGPGRLAAANAAQVPRRTAATISVLALGMGLTSALLVGLSSTRAGAEQGIAEQFPADFLVTAPDAAQAAGLAGRLAGDPRLAVLAGDGTEGGTVSVDPAQGVSGGTARAAVEEIVSTRPGMLVRYAGDVRAELESTLGTLGLVGLGLVGMTALVAVVGVGVTLMLSVTERTRETGLLRAVGMTRRGVRAMVAWEAALSGTGAAVVGAVLGAVYGLLGVRVLDVANGVTSVPVPALAGLAVGVVAVAVIAATAPAVRAGRVPPIRAMQEA